MKKSVFLGVLLVLSGLLSGCWTVKSGQKSGIIVKVAKEGKFWGTYEGEMILGGLENASGVSGRAFHFTIAQFHSDLVKLADYALQNNSHVVVQYHCDAYTMPWSGETQCFADEIKILPDK